MPARIGSEQLVGAEGGLTDLQGPLQLGAGAGQVPEGLEQVAEVVAPEGDGGVVGAEGDLTVARRALTLLGRDEEARTSASVSVT